MNSFVQIKRWTSPFKKFRVVRVNIISDTYLSIKLAHHAKYKWWQIKLQQNKHKNLYTVQIKNIELNKTKKKEWWHLGMKWRKWKKKSNEKLRQNNYISISAKKPCETQSSPALHNLFRICKSNTFIVISTMLSNIWQWLHFSKKKWSIQNQCVS
jgi:hypothetical protein